MYAIFGASLYVAAAVLLAVAGAILARDPARGRRLAVGGAIILVSWVVAIGYGGFELATRLVAVLGIAAAVSSLVGARRRWAAVGVGALLVASVPLVYVLFVHPPLGLIAIYAVAAIGVSAAALSLLPASASRWPLPALGAIAWPRGSSAPPRPRPPFGLRPSPRESAGGHPFALPQMATQTRPDAKLSP